MKRTLSRPIAVPGPVMNRRMFLSQAGALSCAIAAGRLSVFAEEPASSADVEEVHVIFKTHLDIGFTDLAVNVKKTYFEHFIPKVLTLRERIAEEGREERYKWSAGSWLVYTYLESASPENRRRMERAIEASDFVWHGLPFTTHTELLDSSLFRLAAAYSERLDQRFGRQTIAAKMTDVPGHCRAIVPIMAQQGIELLHIGVNEASAMPDVPPLFVWKSIEGAELVVMYQHSYGDVAVLPGGRIAAALSFTGDNQGPHTLQQISSIYAALRKQFPKARVFASDLNALAASIRPIRSNLPVITQEIGDTWIHGPASDPLMMARFRELSRLRMEWIASGRLSANGDADIAFGERFLCVPEHTWGLSIRFLKHWDVYDMPAFRASRDLPEFRLMERSWSEKRENIQAAVSTLPRELASEADARLKSLVPKRPDLASFRRLDSPDAVHETSHFRIAFDPKTGAIGALEHRESGRQWAGGGRNLGLFSYQTFSQPEFDRFMREYVVEKFRKVEWALNSWTKVGLEKSGVRSGLHFTALKQLMHAKRSDGHLFLADLEVPGAGDSGCPRQLYVETFLPDNDPVVSMSLRWFEKPAARLPEALWFSFVPEVASDGRLMMDKMGQPISPMEVISNGNRNFHGLTRGVSYRDQRGGFELETLDAFLLAPGRRPLLIFDNEQPDIAGGLHFCLYNNLTGTNFTMWFEDEMQFRFVLKFGGGWPAPTEAPGGVAGPRSRQAAEEGQ